MFEFYKNKMMRVAAKKCIEFGLKHNQDFFDDVVNERALKLARFCAMKILENQNLLHCDKCPIRFGLIKIGNGAMLCENHYKEFKTQETGGKNGN